MENISVNEIDESKEREMLISLRSYKVDKLEIEASARISTKKAGEKRMKNARDADRKTDRESRVNLKITSLLQPSECVFLFKTDIRPFIEVCTLLNASFCFFNGRMAVSMQKSLIK